MRRWGSLLGTAALVAAMSGCGAESDGGADLVIWTDGLKVDAVSAVAAAFAEERDIEVDVEVISTDLQANFVTADAAGNGPDVVVGAHDWIGNLVQNGAVDPLPLAPEALTEFDPTAIEATTYRGRLYGIPYGVEALALYRNTDVAPEAPATFDEVVEAGVAAQRAGVVEDAIALPVGQEGDAYHMEPLFTSGGGYLFGTDSEGYVSDDLGLDTPGAIAAAERISALGEQGLGVLNRSISVDNNIARFAEGRSAFLLSGPWALPDLRASGVQFAVDPVPGFAGADAARPFTGAQAFMVASNGANKAWAQEFVTAGVTTAEAMTTMYELAGLPPALIEVADAAAAADPDFAVFSEAAAAGDPMPALPAMSAVWEPLGQAYSAIVGGADPAATMRATADTIRRAIEED